MTALLTIGIVAQTQKETMRLYFFLRTLIELNQPPLITGEPNKTFQTNSESFQLQNLKFLSAQNSFQNNKP